MMQSVSSVGGRKVGIAAGRQKENIQHNIFVKKYNGIYLGTNIM